MQLQKLGESETIDGHYDRLERITNHGDTLIDGETSRVFVEPPLTTRTPYIAVVKNYQETGDFIFPELSNDYALVKTSDQGLQNLQTDGFRFIIEGDPTVPISELTEIAAIRRFIP